MNNGITKEQLKGFHREGVELRQRSGEDDAYRFLKRCYEQIRDERILEESPVAPEEIERYGAACDVVLEYAGTCTQQAFRRANPHLHLTAVHLEKWVYNCASAALSHAREASEGNSGNFAKLWEPVICELHRAGNSLGVSYQRPKRLFKDRDTELAVSFSEKAAAYYLEKAKGILASRGAAALSDDDRQTILNCVRYCGNHATALYQRAEDYAQEGDSRGAIEYYDRSLEQRLTIEEQMIVPVFGEKSLKYAQSMTQRAGIAQAKGRCGDRDGFVVARSLYEKAIGLLVELESKDGDMTDGGCVTVRVARLGAQFGLAWCLLNLGDAEDAYELHRKVYQERAEVLGDSHMDTGKSASAMEVAHRKLDELQSEQDR